MIQGRELEIPNLNLFQMLANTVEKYPDRLAAIFAGHESTYKDLFRGVLGMMGQLEAAGVKQGDRVAIMLPNCPHYLTSYYAITGLGAIVVQVNPMSPAPELEYLLQDSGASILIALDKLIPVVRSTAVAQTLKKRIFVRFGKDENALNEGEVWFDEWLAAAQNPGTPARFDPAETIAVLQYTGGTTGRPKGAMLTHKNLVSNVYQSLAAFPIQPNDKDMMICALPFFHVYAMTVCMNYSVLVGLPMLIVPRFNAEELLQLIRQYRPTMFPAVPTMYVALSQVLPKGSSDLESLRLCNSGGAPMPEHVMTKFEELSGALVLEGYGLSEASPVTHFNPSVEGRKIGSIGLPLCNTEVKIVSVEDSRVELPTRTAGELAVRGPQVMKGYWNRPEDTKRTLVDGWLLTGDIAELDEDGYTYIVDRKKDLIIASGYNVYPREVEEALYKHPDVVEAAVVGVPDDYRGETVKAFVAVKPGSHVKEEDIVAWCKSQLSAYKVPKQIEFRAELPKSAVGKILRRELRA